MHQRSACSTWAGPATCAGESRRVGSYWGDLAGREHLMRMVPRIHRVEAVVCASEHEAAWAERNLLDERMPVWNRTVGGQESPVHIRLDAGAKAP